MTWEMVVTIVLAVIGLIGSIIISIYKESKATRDAKDEILNNQRSTERALTADRQLIKEKLSEEHREILEKQRDILTYVVSESDRRKLREELFTEAQKDTQRKVEEINDFLNDWKRLTVENAELQAENSTLRHENEMLCERLAEYENDEQPQP